VVSHIDQWHRLGRWYARILRQPPIDPVEYDDFMWAFFQNCWHDTLCEADRNGIEKILKTHQVMLDLADLANGTKHMALDRPRAGTGTTPGHRSLEVHGGQPEKTQLHYYVRRDDGSFVKALDLAGEAMGIWHDIIAKLTPVAAGEGSCSVP
jgi:hypothetical protein